MANKPYRTGDRAPESGTFRVDSLVSGDSASNDDTEVVVEKGEQFPLSPSSNEAANWVKV
ncbi:YjzC family protein [Natribacillus halophilus]|uniref:YjzC-like protein n=1 Tax=Natribacillus halophilus TaxID=549003 RepID=A0A1G8Q4B3_9BACI|nr:YjzC family protein [Natribacillus halophilus]SDI99604.1 YjzC-like protein [Natribacillus halophilus]